MNGRVVTLVALGGLLATLHGGCGGGPGGLSRALTMQRVDPALALLRSFENHARLRKADDLYDLVRLFTPTCRLSCRGFVAHTVDRGGGYHIARWVPRMVGGTLLVDRSLRHGLGDLSRALASFGRLEVFEVRPLRLRRFPRRALVRARYRARGIDRAGALRVDSGLLDLDLVRRPGGWRIDGFVIARVHTLRRAGVAYSAGKTPEAKATASAARPALKRPRQLLFDDGALVLLEGQGKTLWGRPLAGGPQRALLRLPRGPLVAIAAADVDGDGATDLCLASGGGDSGLYLRRGKGYQRVPGRLPGRAADCRIADLDNDGSLDLYVTRGGPQGADPYATPGVSDLIAHGPLGRAPLRISPSAGKGWGRQACVADLDGDGKVEVLLVDELAPPRILARERLVGGLGGAAAGCALADVDGDGRLDVYLSTRGARSAFLFGRPQVGSPLHRGAIAQSGGLWLNRSRPGKLRFRRGAALRDAVGWTGWAAFLDHDSDGDLDLWRRRLEPDALGEARWFWRVRGPGLRWGRSPKSARRQLLGALRWRAQELWVNDGKGALSRGTFASGLAAAASGAGVAADLDEDDGRLDLLGGQAPQRWRGSEGMLGEAGAGAAVLVHLRGAACNRDALGAVVRARTQGRWQTRVVGSSSGWPGGPPGWVHIGLGAALRVERLEVRWPGGRRDVHEDLPVGKAIELSPGKPPRWRSFNARFSRGSLASRPPSASSASTRRSGLAARLAALKLNSRGAGGGVNSAERLDARVPRKGVVAVVVSKAVVPAPICAALRRWKTARLFSVAPAATKGCGGRWEVSPETLRPFGALLPAVLLFRDGRLVKLWAAGAVPGALPPGG